MVRYDVYEDKVRALKKTLEEAGYSLDVDNLRVRLKELEAELEKPEVWSDIEKSKHVSREAQQIRNKLDVFDKAEKAVGDAEMMIELAEEEGDESVLEEVDKDLSEAEKEIEDIRLRTLRARAEPKRATGRKCSIVCISATPKSTVINSPSTIVWTATEPGLNRYASKSRARTPTAT